MPRESSPADDTSKPLSVAACGAASIDRSHEKVAVRNFLEFTFF